MAETVIKVENLSKKFTLAHQDQESYTTLRDSLTRGVKNIFTAFQSKNQSANPAREEFWALRDAAFEIQQGDRVGVIGRNGAGKSTLLKILSRIMEPTTGRIRIKGRMASLLEVGTGFHPELTGRENIYLNGAILGMGKTEIQRKFDEIVAFAETEKFLDTPVKRYSSGMYVRLAFAVAAHLEPEILIVDEVLAVGDARFQKKCLGKMENISEQDGRTVLFVSHNMAAINQLCNKGLLLESGRVKLAGDIDKVTQEYANFEMPAAGFIELEDYPSRKGSGEITFKWAKIFNADSVITSDFSLGQDINIQFAVNAERKIQNIRFSVQIKTSAGFPVCNMVDVDSGFQIGTIDGFNIYNITLKDIRFYPDIYSIGLWIGNTESDITYDYVEDCLAFHIVDSGRLTMRSLPRSTGLLFLTPIWEEVSTRSIH
jgi:lipopolysaccharide transport system ATP-binding protein